MWDTSRTCVCVCVGNPWGSSALGWGFFLSDGLNEAVTVTTVEKLSQLFSQPSGSLHTDVNEAQRMLSASSVHPFFPKFKEVHSVLRWKCASLHQKDARNSLKNDWLEERGHHENLCRGRGWWVCGQRWRQVQLSCICRSKSLRLLVWCHTPSYITVTRWPPRHFHHPGNHCQDPWYDLTTHSMWSSS